MAFVLPGDYLGLSGSDHHRYDIEAIADSRVCRVALPQMKGLRARYPHLERKLLQRACQELDAAQDAALALARLQPAENSLISCSAWLRARPSWVAMACVFRCRWAAATSPTILV